MRFLRRNMRFPRARQVSAVQRRPCLRVGSVSPRRTRSSSYSVAFDRYNISVSEPIVTRSTRCTRWAIYRKIKRHLHLTHMIGTSRNRVDTGAILNALDLEAQISCPSLEVQIWKSLHKGGDGADACRFGCVQVLGDRTWVSQNMGIKQGTGRSATANCCNCSSRPDCADPAVTLSMRRKQTLTGLPVRSRGTVAQSNLDTKRSP